MLLKLHDSCLVCFIARLLVSHTFQRRATICKNRPLDSVFEFGCYPKYTVPQRKIAIYSLIGLSKNLFKFLSMQMIIETNLFVVVFFSISLFFFIFYYVSCCCCCVSTNFFYSNQFCDLTKYSFDYVLKMSLFIQNTVVKYSIYLCGKLNCMELNYAFVSVVQIFFFPPFLFSSFIYFIEM